MNDENKAVDFPRADFFLAVPIVADLITRVEDLQLRLRAAGEGGILTSSLITGLQAALELATERDTRAYIQEVAAVEAAMRPATQPQPAVEEIIVERRRPMGTEPSEN
jgi:hypothetical protein